MSTATDDPESTGDGGNLTITAADSVIVRGESTVVDPGKGEHLSRLTTRTTGPGNAGNLIINTDLFSIEDGAQVSAGNNTFFEATGAAGSLMIIADNLVNVSGFSSLVGENGNPFFSRLTTRTLGGGNAGPLTINIG